MESDTGAAEDAIVDPLWELTLLALAEGLDLHRFSGEAREALPGTLAMSALDVALAMLVRHPVWTRRLAALHAAALQGSGVDRGKLDSVVARYPLPGGGRSATEGRGRGR
jgi:hypothetical protein